MKFSFTYIFDVGTAIYRVGQKTLFYGL